MTYLQYNQYIHNEFIEMDRKKLQPLVKKLPSYEKDDNDFLRKIDELNDKQTIPQMHC